MPLHDHARPVLLRSIAFGLLASLLLLPGCGRKKRVLTPVPALPGTIETGIASWYGRPYHGRRSANGEIYDMEKFTAAHRTLPFDTWVEVLNLSNHKTTQVRITDRGPFVNGRIIDLSHAAARQVGLIGPGIAKVRLTVIEAPPAPPAEDLFGVQVGAFLDHGNAERLAKDMKKRFGECRLVARDGSPRMWRVIVGREHTVDGANALAESLRVHSGTAYVVRLDATASDPL